MLFPAGKLQVFQIIHSIHFWKKTKMDSQNSYSTTSALNISVAVNNLAIKLQIYRKQICYRTEATHTTNRKIS